MLDDYQPFYQRTLEELRKGVVANLEYATQLQAEMKAIEAQLGEITVNSRRCELCGGQMFDLSPLTSIRFLVEGAVPTTREHLALSYGMRVPQSWECQHCGAFVTSVSRDEGIQTWTREDISPKSKSLATLIFQHLPSVDKVMYEVTPYQRGWLLEIGNEWYYIGGTKERVQEKLGMD